MRGKVFRKRVHRRTARITPAYAGKSCPMRCVRFLLWDHPRLCGEKPTYLLQRSRLQGSPPPMRGKVCKNNSSSTADEDHPRLCGEKMRMKSQVCSGKGSPPPMRGKVVPSTPKQKTMRITPAYAGKSKCSRSGHDLQQDHPRLCGEKRDWKNVPRRW